MHDLGYSLLDLVFEEELFLETNNDQAALDSGHGTCLIPLEGQQGLKSPSQFVMQSFPFKIKINKFDSKDDKDDEFILARLN